MRRVCLIAGLLMTAACSLNNPGAEPPRGKIYFPTAVAIADDHLLVASSNFDVRYNAGSLQAYDLAELNSQVDACLADPNAIGCDCRQDGACVLANTRELLASEVLIDSFATGIAYSAALGRVYVPTRSNGGLTFAEFAAGELSCGQDGRCGALNIAGIEPGTNNITMPSQPTSVATGAAADLGFTADGDPLEGEYVLVGDRDQALSLFLDGPGDVPKLLNVRPGLPGEISGITTAGRSAYLSTVNDANPIKVVTQVGFGQADAVDVSQDAFRFSYKQADLGIDLGARSSVRSIAFVPGSTTDLVAVTLNPSALVRVDLQSPRVAPAQPSIESIVSLGSGPSKVEVGRIGMDPRAFAFVSCFDSREIMVVDLELNRLVSVIQGVTGPFSLALDTARSRLYVGDFRSSTVRIVDLAPLVSPLSPEDLADFAPLAPRVIAILGQPLEQQALQ